MTPWPLIAQVLLLGDPLTVRANARFAGAINSVTWRGTQFIDHYDHGRELQVAVHVAGYGGSECYNPTEAGSQRDGTGDTSSSVVLGTWRGDHGFSTSSRLAFWNVPGEKSPGCKEGAANTTIVSDFVLSKIVTLANDGLLIYDFTIDVPGDYEGATIEAPVMYMPKGFSRFKFFDPKTQTSVPGIPKEHRDIPILACDGKGYAAAMWSEGAYQTFKTFLRDTNAVIVGRKIAPLRSAAYSFKTYIAFGTAQSVRAAITRAYEERP